MKKMKAIMFGICMTFICYGTSFAQWSAEILAIGTNLEEMLDHQY